MEKPLDFQEDPFRIPSMDEIEESLKKSKQYEKLQQINKKFDEIEHLEPVPPPEWSQTVVCSPKEGEWCGSVQKIDTEDLVKDIHHNYYWKCKVCKRASRLDSPYPSYFKNSCPRYIEYMQGNQQYKCLSNRELDLQPKQQLKPIEQKSNSNMANIICSIVLMIFFVLSITFIFCIPLK